MGKVVLLTGITRNETSWPLLFAEGLAKHKVDVTMISGYANYNYDLKYREYQLAHPVEMRGNYLKIIRVGSSKIEKKKLLYRFIRYIELTLAIKKELKKHKADYYFIYSTPPFLGLLGKTIKRKGGKSIYIAQDLFPDNLFAMKPQIESSPIGKILRKVEKNIYNSCNDIVTVSQTMKQRIVLSGISESKVKVIRNWADIQTLRAISRENNSLFDEYNIDRKKFIVSYAGSLGRLQRLDVLLDVAKELKDYKDILIVIFGMGECKEKLEKIIEANSLQNVVMLPIQSKDKISEAYSFGDIEYVSVSPGVMKMATPHKILDIMAVGRPLIAVMDKDCDTAELINNKELGIVVSCEKTEIKQAILFAYDNKSKIIKMGCNGRRYAETIDYDSQIKKYISLYN